MEKCWKFNLDLPILKCCAKAWFVMSISSNFCFQLDFEQLSKILEKCSKFDPEFSIFKICSELDLWFQIFETFALNSTWNNYFRECWKCARNPISNLQLSKLAPSFDLWFQKFESFALNSTLNSSRKCWKSAGNSWAKIWKQCQIPFFAIKIRILLP